MSETKDRGLNLAMAELCKLPIYNGTALSQYPQVYVLGERCLFLENDMALRFAHIPKWNPVGNFQQVHEFVIPALKAAGFDWLMRHEGDYPAEVEVYAGNPIAAYAARAAGSETTLCRAFCEAALEAWQLKEKT